MDGYQGFPSEFEVAAEESPPAADVAAAIGTDERRMHVRAYNYWVSLLDGRDYPSIEDLEPGEVAGFAENSVLLDFTCGHENPATAYIGAAIRRECDLNERIKTTADVPSRSLLSRLTDHYMQIIANRAPVGFEAEFVNQRGEAICYRGILMPFSSDGDTIDFIYGVISWKQAAFIPPPPPSPQIDLPLDESSTLTLREKGRAVAAEESDVLPEITLDADAGLADRLCAARETAEAVKSADVRSRAALYQALSLAHDFALAAAASPDEYAELLEESGMKAQSRAPMTPVVKLVFGIDYEKTRVTEFASALSYARRNNVAAGGFQAFLESHSGGLKALVAAERQARRPGPPRDNRGEKARSKVRQLAPFSIQDLSEEDEFCLVLTRRGRDGGHEAIAVVHDPVLIDRAIRRAAA